MRIQPAGQYTQLDLTGDSGAAFPAHPSDGQLFYRTDRNVIYFYKSAVSQWLSLTRYEATFTIFSITANGGVASFPLDSDIYLEALIVWDRVATTNDGSNFWTVKLYGDNTAGSATVLTSFSTAADTHDNHILHNVAYNAIIASATYVDLLVQPEKTGSPGGIAGSVKLAYRVVG
jgi:hypothetical protein